MKYYGLKQKSTDGWLSDQSGMIFWTTSKAVANEQLKIIHQPDDFEVCEFIEDKENDMASWVGKKCEACGGNATIEVFDMLRKINSKNGMECAQHYGPSHFFCKNHERESIWHDAGLSNLG